MTDNNSRLRQWCRLFAPILTARYDKWCARRAKARRAYERQLAALAEPPTPPVEPREPRDIDAVFRRQRPYRPEEAWRSYADDLHREARARRQAWRMTDGTSIASNWFRR
jgi:hypothetical protein